MQPPVPPPIPPDDNYSSLQSNNLLINNQLIIEQSLILAGSNGQVSISAPVNTSNYNLTLPLTQGTSNTYLKNDGTGLLSWSSVSGGGTPAGVTNDVQYNNGGSFGGTSAFQWNSGTLTAGNSTLSGSSIGFFNKSAPKQYVVNNIQSIIDALVSFGLVSGWIQQGQKLLGSSAVGSSLQGRSVSISADGNTVAIGGINDDGGIGATWIFTRIAGVWTQQGSKLIGSVYVGASGQGISVSLSSDGNTLAVGGNGDDGGIGATWIFTRTAGVWTQQGSKLVGTGYVGTPEQGTSVSLSNDGNTLAVGGPSDDIAGATWIFTRTTGVWSQQGSKLVGTGYLDNSKQGFSVDLSGDSDTLAVGGYLDNVATETGATWIFTRTAGVWSQQGSKLIGTGGSDPSHQGRSVSLSDNGNILAIGGNFDDNNIGATWIFTRSAGVWTQEGSKLVGSGYSISGSVYQGQSISLSGDGNTMAVGASNNRPSGSTWLFTKIGGSWIEGPLTGSPSTHLANQGYSVALSNDGQTLIIGSPDDNVVGGAWIFILS